MTNDVVPSPGVSLTGARFLGGIILSGVQTSAFFTTGVVLVLVLLRGAVRRTWMADAIFVLVLTSLSLPQPASLPVQAVFTVAIVWILRRFGFLSLIVMSVTHGWIEQMPLAATSWYASLALTTPILIGALAAWSLYVMLAARPGTASRPASA